MPKQPQGIQRPDLLQAMVLALSGSNQMLQGGIAPTPKEGPLLGERVLQPSSWALFRGAAVRQQSGHVPAGVVLLVALGMVLASGLGCLPFFIVGKLSPAWAALANAVASGVMLAASFGLVAEGAAYGGSQVMGGMLGGAVFVKLTQHFLKG